MVALAPYAPPQRYTRPAIAIADANGHAVFTFDSAPTSIWVTGTVSIVSAPPGAQFIGTVAEVPWSQWFGAGSSSIVQVDERTDLSVLGVGLVAGRQYVAWFIGSAETTPPLVAPQSAPPAASVFSVRAPFFATAAGFQLTGADLIIGPVSTLGFTALHVFVDTAGGPINVTVSWLTAGDGSGVETGHRFCTVPQSGPPFSLGMLELTTPHFGAYVKVTLSNPNGVNTPISCVVEQSTSQGFGFGGPDWPIAFHGSIAAGGSNTLANAWCFGGPAFVVVNMSACTNWAVTLNVQGPSGAPVQYDTWSSAQNDPAKIRQMYLFPAAPVSLLLNNQDGVARSVTAAVYLDVWRPGAAA